MKPTPPDHRNRRPFFKRIGPYMPAMIILSLAVPVVIYLAVMQSIGWRTPVLGVKGGLSYAAPAGKSLFLYTSPHTTTYLAGIGGNYETLLLPWRNYFTNRKLDFTEIQDAAELGKLKQGVLVLPSALSLSEEERAEILAFQSRGGGVLSTWATGTRNSKGDWEGWQFLERLGARMLGEIPADAEVHHLVLSGESPVSHTHPAGQRIGLSKTSEALLRFKGEMVAGRFMNWARIMDDERRGEGAIVYSEANEKLGRVAFFAFAETVWESRPLAAYDFIDDTLQWLQREPAVVLAAWPNGKRAAQVIEMDTEQGFENAVPFASMMHSLDYPATFYVLTSVGKLFPQVMARLASEFELAYHGDVHDSFKGQSAQQQALRIQTMRAEMASVVPDTKGITGFRAPTEGYDATTEELLQKSGIRHHTADPNRTEARLPLLAKIEGVERENTLVVLPRTQRDDINLYGEKLTAEQTTQALISDFDLTLEHGALGLLSIHSQNFQPDSVLTKALPGFLVHLKQQRKQVWVASAGQVADWWRERERFKLSSVNTGKRLEFNITITGTKPVLGASLVVMLPHRGILPSVQSTKIGGMKPAVSLVDNYRAAIVFDSLNPGNHVYQVTFAP
ncbi:MAG: polysaccharide deacetylase family protein [Gammaproteobacteria bacterium]|nr:polysaccharide deacetylase family protein [Gammaproteobacteria bacterium]MBU4113489.1 polysaccharide deacetylase family protein [Gammaproteobacteria bacterium]